MAACIDVQEACSDCNKLRAVFSLFDCDGNDLLSRDDIIGAMDRFGHVLFERDLDEIMEQHDLT